MSDPVTLAIPRLMTEESFRSLPYTDQSGHLTIGYGMNLSAGISKKQAAQNLQWTLVERYSTLKNFSWWHDDEPVRGSVILDMAYNLGLAGLLNFINMLAAYGKKDWKTASQELINSKAERQLPERYTQLAKILLEGQ
jgi:lysozyme